MLRLLAPKRRDLCGETSALARFCRHPGPSLPPHTVKRSPSTLTPPPFRSAKHAFHRKTFSQTARQPYKRQPDAKPPNRRAGKFSAIFLEAPYSQSPTPPGGPAVGLRHDGTDMSTFFTVGTLGARQQAARTPARRRVRAVAQGLSVRSARSGVRLRATL